MVVPLAWGAPAPQEGAMGLGEILGVAASFSLLAGWRLYAALLVAGLAMRFGLIALPSELSALAVLAHPVALGVTALGAIAEFLADKVALVDSVWDGVHSVVRPMGGALLALAIVDPGDPLVQLLAFLLGGGAALATHSAKAGVRLAVNASPEPASNIAVSGIEDLATGLGLALAVTYPWAAVGLVILMLIICALIIRAARRFIADLKDMTRRPAEPGQGP
jgi:hypothetical protein